MTSDPAPPAAGFERTLRNALHAELTSRMRHVLLHDLKGPGQIVLSAVHMLQKNAATADAATLQKYCDWIRDAVKDIAARAEKILPPSSTSWSTTSSTPRPAADAAPETCDLMELTEDVVHLLRDDSALKGVEFKIEPSDGPPPPVPGPGGELRLVLQALLFGVLDRVPENSTAYIRLSSANGQANWSVSAPGGDPPDASAFELRYDVMPPASGIGWYVARSIARERGGDLSLEGMKDDHWQLVLRLP